MSAINPTLQLNFAKTKRLDPRITFSRNDTGASQATYFGADGLLKYAGIGEPRFDHDPVTGESLGLLIEEQRANLLFRSAEFDDAVWSKTNAAITANTIVAPDGTLTADLQEKSSGSSNINQGATSTASTVYCGSVFVKAASLSSASIALVNSTSSTVIVRGHVNLTTGAITNTTGTGLLPPVNVGNGWWRIAIQGAAVDATTRLFIYPGVWFDSALGSIYIWGAQLEAGAFPTSYIPTTSAAVTRNPDIASMTGVNFSSWYNQSEGTFVCDFYGDSTGTFSVLCAVSNGSTSNRHYLVVSSTNSIRYYGTVGGVAWTQKDTGNSANAGVMNTTAASHSISEQSFVLNGGTIVTDNETVPSGMTKLNIRSSAIDSVNGNLHIARLTYYPKRLPDATIKALSK